MKSDLEAQKFTEAKWAEIDLDALMGNTRRIREKVGTERRICAVVKANGYGSGVLEIAEPLLEAGADQFAVSSLNEALQLRTRIKDRDILVLGNMPDGSEDLSISAGLQHTVTGRDKAERISQAAVRLGKTAKIHIKLDTGMTRLGFPMSEAAIEEILEIAKLPGLDPEGIFTHFARADEIDKTWAKKQLERYLWFVGELEKRGLTFRIRHAANSAAIMEMPEAWLDMVRPGIILYGIYPSGEVDRKQLLIHPVLSLKSRLSHVKVLSEPRQISYGGKYTGQKGDRIGTIGIGYADGFSRAQSGSAEALTGGHRVQILGNICMDQCMLDLNGVPDAKRGDEVVLIGTSGQEQISADDVAARYRTIGYEVVCAVGLRVPRYYYKNQSLIKRVDYLEHIWEPDFGEELQDLL